MPMLWSHQQSVRSINGVELSFSTAGTVDLCGDVVVAEVDNGDASWRWDTDATDANNGRIWSSSRGWVGNGGSERNRLSSLTDIDGQG